MHGNLHHYRQLSKHRDSYSCTKAWSWTSDAVTHTALTFSFWELYSMFLEWLGARPHLIEPEFHRDLEDLSMPRPLCLSAVLICFCLKWGSLFRCTSRAGGRTFYLMCIKLQWISNMISDTLFTHLRWPICNIIHTYMMLISNTHFHKLNY